MRKIEIIEEFDPPADAMVRSFHCAVCDKAHLQTGKLARVWVLYQEGYASQAAIECAEKATNGEYAPIKEVVEIE